MLLDNTHDGPDDALRANRSKERTFAYDVAFGPESTQTEVYEQTTRGLVDSVTAGYHATAFAYGPTGVLTRLVRNVLGSNAFVPQGPARRTLC